MSGLDGQGLEPYGLGSLVTGFGAVVIFLAFLPYLTPTNWFSKPLANFGKSLELRPWWRDACLPNETEGVWVKLQGSDKMPSCWIWQLWPISMVSKTLKALSLQDAPPKMPVTF